MRNILTAPALILAIAASGAAQSQSAQQLDLFAYSEGARLVQIPADAELTHMYESPLNLIDGSRNTDWTGDAAGPPTFVLELEERTELHRIAFDAAFLNRDEKAARNVTVEVSDTSATSGYVPILAAALKMKADNQAFGFDPKQLPVGRWVRLTVESNHGDSYSALTGFRGYGRKLTATATMPNVTGTYQGWSGWGALSLTQSGNQVTGCYEYQNGVVTGTVEGRTLKLRMVETASDGTVTELRGDFGMSRDGRKLVGMGRPVGRSHDLGYATYMSADRTSARAASCG